MNKIPFLKLILARIQSKSPKFFTGLRYGSGAVVLLAAFAIGIIKSNFFPITADLGNHIVNICSYVEASLISFWGFTFLPTTDPILSNANTETTTTTNK